MSAAQRVRTVGHRADAGTRCPTRSRTHEALLHGLHRPRGPGRARRRGRAGRAREDRGAARRRRTRDGRRPGRLRAGGSARPRSPPRARSAADYRASDLDGRFLVVAATSTRAVNERVYADADARGMLCNVVDVPELCSFILPAVHRADPIAVAISTGGASPALAQRLRDDVARLDHARAHAAGPRAAGAPALGQGTVPDLRGAARLLPARRRERLG